MESRGVLRSPGGNPPARGTPPPQNDVASGAQPVALLKELNVLRLSVRDKDFQLMNLQRDLGKSHEEVTRLNKMLVEKKESGFKQHEAFTRLEDELVATRDELARTRGARQQAPSAALREENTALHRDVARLRKELADLQWRNRQLQDRASSGQQASPDRDLQQQLERLRYDNGALQRENSSLKNKVEVLNVQVTTYNEDFHKERSDRERAQGAIQSLKEERESLTQVINLLAREHGIRIDAYGIVPQQE